MLDSVKANNPDRPVTIVTTPQGEKMSDLLETLVEPYQEPNLTDSAERNLLMMGIIGWNAALVDDALRKPLIDDFIRTVTKSATKADVDDLRAMINELVERKRKLFPAVNRFIMDFRLAHGPDGRHLSVISTIPEPPK